MDNELVNSGKQHGYWLPEDQQYVGHTWQEKERTQVILMPLSFETKKFVLGRRGQVSGWKGSGAWGQRRKSDLIVKGRMLFLGSVVLNCGRWL